MKKTSFAVIKKKHLLILVGLLFALASVIVCFVAIRPTFTPNLAKTIVIDAGHGGIDGGATGVKTGIDESSLNLEYAQSLQKMCQGFGFNVVMTRSDMNGLYSVTASNKKRSDMEKRRQIIENANADVVVSLHMNSYPLPSAHGAQVFYAKGAEAGKALADSVQAQIVSAIPSSRKVSSVGDYYMLNCTARPSIIVECGFLSNPEEEAMLVTQKYRETLCYSILSGILKFLEMN